MPIAQVGASGLFSIQAPGGRWSLSIVTFDRNGVHWEGDVESSSREAQEIRLGPLESIAGEVRFEDGAPGTGLTVWRAEEASWHSTTAADGSFRLRDLPRWQGITLCVEREDGQIFENRFPLATTDQGEALRLVIPSGPVVNGPSRSLVTGRVVDEEGQPVSAARLSLVRAREAATLRRAIARAASSDALAKAVSDLQGVFELRASVPPGTYSVVVVADGYAPTDSDPLELVDENDRLDIGDFVVDRGLRIEGRVVDGSREPVGEAEVTVAINGGSEDRGWTQLDRSSARTDSEGRFVLEAIPSGFELEVRAVAPDGSGTSRRLSESELRRPVLLEIAPTRALSVLVLDSHGGHAGIAAVEVRSRTTGGSASGRAVRLWRASTNEEGRALLSGLDCGALVLEVAASGFLPSSVDVGPVDCPVAEETPVVVTLSEAVAVSGRVLGADGTPISEALVLREGVGVQSDTLGNYRLRIPGFARARIRYGRDDLGWFEVDLEVGSADILQDLVLGTTASAERDAP